MNTYSFLNKQQDAITVAPEEEESTLAWEFLNQSHKIFTDLHTLRDRHPERFELYCAQLHQELGLQPGQVFGYLARLKDLALEGCKSN